VANPPLSTTLNLQRQSINKTCFPHFTAPSNQPATNVLILLHGLGDTNESFSSFARSLSLPETACIAVRGSVPLPFDLGGFHWGDDILIDQATGDIDVDAGFKKSVKALVDDLIRNTLIHKCGYKPREILLFGFGQGGYVALNCAVAMGEEELGGVVSIGGALPAAVSLPEKKNRTPVILCKGSRKSAISPEDLDRLKRTFEFLEMKEWSKTGDGMPSNRDEMMPIMQFFARRLKSLRGIPQGSVEIT
jgi:predicted esterase